MLIWLLVTIQYKKSKWNKATLKQEQLLQMHLGQGGQLFFPGDNIRNKKFLYDINFICKKQ